MGRSRAVDAHVGQRVRYRRIELGLTQQKLSGLMGVSYQQLQKYEHGTNRISGSTLWRLSEVLGVEPAYFFEELPRSRGSKGGEGSAEPAPRGHSDRETLELVKAYAAIEDPLVRKAVRQMLLSLAKSGRPGRARGRRRSEYAPGS